MSQNLLCHLPRHRQSYSYAVRRYSHHRAYPPRLATLLADRVAHVALDQYEAHCYTVGSCAVRWHQRIALSACVVSDAVLRDLYVRHCRCSVYDDPFASTKASVASLVVLSPVVCVVAVVPLAKTTGPAVPAHPGQEIWMYPVGAETTIGAAAVILVVGV